MSEQLRDQLQATLSGSYTLERELGGGGMSRVFVEFRRGDIGYDGKPANECASCLAFNLGRAFDAGGQADSAAIMFGRYLVTPFVVKSELLMDPVRVPAIHERLGQIYEAKGETAKAVVHYRAFIDLWRNADAELQPRVADARKRLARLTPVERARGKVAVPGR